MGYALFLLTHFWLSLCFTSDVNEELVTYTPFGLRGK